MISSLGLTHDGMRLIGQTCTSNGLDLTQTQLERLDQYSNLLLTWNEKVNLVSRAASHSAILSHIIHSLSVLFKIEIPGGFRLLDLGTGGGLPGIPISIARPDLVITLIDSIGKKTTAVVSILNQLHMECEVISTRAENLRRTHLAFFDVVISRAVAPLSDLIRWSRPLLAITDEYVPRPRPSQRAAIAAGSLLAMKGGDLQFEIETAKKKTGEKNITTYKLSFPGAEEVGLVDKKLVVVQVG